MADFVFNIAKGKIKYYCELPVTNDALVIVLLKEAEADSTLKDYNDLDTLLSGANNTEADFTNYTRKVSGTDFTAPSITVDDTNDQTDIDIGDITWSSAGGATDNTLVKLLVCYDDDDTGGDDSDIIPLTSHDFAITTDGTDLIAQVGADGFVRSA